MKTLAGMSGSPALASGLPHKQAYPGNGQACLEE
ncbi:hypothetical protein J2T17_001304 [Paenibacillus mucilaginosus]